MLVCVFEIGRTEYASLSEQTLEKVRVVSL